MLTPVENPPELQAPLPPPSSPRELQASGGRPSQRLSQNRLQASARRSALNPPASPEAYSASASVSSALAAPVGEQQTLPSKLDLNMAGAALATEQKRRQSLLADVIDAQQKQAGGSKGERAFTKLSVVTPNIAEERFTATGGRVIRFSGGDCMRMPNPAASPLGDTRQATMENC